MARTAIGDHLADACLDAAVRLLHRRPLITGPRDFAGFCEMFDVDGGAEDMRDAVDAAGLPGWAIPGNYGCPGGDDLLIRETRLLDYRAPDGISMDLDAEAPPDEDGDARPTFGV